MINYGRGFSATTRMNRMNQVQRRIAFFILLWLGAVAPAALGAAEWKFVAPMPHGHYAGDATQGPDGRIYLMGGGNSQRSNDGRFSNLYYDPRTERWEYLMPVPGWIETDHVVVYLSPGKWKWVPLTEAESVAGITRNTDMKREGDGVAVVTGKDGRIYWIGGRGKWTGRGENEVLPFDPISGKWPEATSEKVIYSSNAHGTAYGIRTILHTDMPPMLERRYYHEAVVTSDGSIYAIGGRQDEMNLDSHGNVSGHGIFVLDSMECWDPMTRSWKYKAPLLSKRSVFGAAVDPSDRIFVFGGTSGTLDEGSREILDTVHVYDPRTDRWSMRRPMPEPRYGHKAVYAADGRFYVLGGGKGYRTPPLKDVLIYDPVKDTWQKGPSMQIPRDLLAAVATPDGRIYAIGGTDVGAYPFKSALNDVFPNRKSLVYAGKIQNTVEVLQVGR
jgi:N-acetylneuraminic acid mutarotase